MSAGGQNHTQLFAIPHRGAGGNVSGAVAGQDYQKYMHQYADQYMGSGKDYQKYMHQYADQYMGSGKAGANVSGAGAGQDYQKYMNQYEKYMHQYADKYMSAGGQNQTQLFTIPHWGAGGNV